jgi:hypothetical protein
MKYQNLRGGRIILKDIKVLKKGGSILNGLSVMQTH